MQESNGNSISKNKSNNKKILIIGFIILICIIVGLFILFQFNKNEKLKRISTYKNRDDGKKELFANEAVFVYFHRKK